MFQRLRRILFHTGAIGSVLLLLVVLFLWPRSYFQFESINYGASTTVGGGITSAAGRFGGYYGNFSPTRGEGEWPNSGFPVGLHFQRYPSNFAALSAAWNDWSYSYKKSTDPVIHYYSILGCEYQVLFPDIPASTRRDFRIPYSHLALLLTIMPAAWLLMLRKRLRHSRRIARGQCVTCGYDLRAHQPGSTCPECGSRIGELRSSLH